MPAFKAKVALARSRAIEHWLNWQSTRPNQITAWKAQLESDDSDVCGPGCMAPPWSAVDVKSLQAKFGQLALENNFFGRSAHQGGITERKTIQP